jgi:esterase/lipase
MPHTLILKGATLFTASVMKLVLYAPIWLVQGTADAPPYMRQSLFPLMVNVPWKRYVEIGEGTHMIMWEKNRDQLFHVVEDFLTQPDPAER